MERPSGQGPVRLSRRREEIACGSIHRWMTGAADTPPFAGNPVSNILSRGTVAFRSRT